ncbi:MAG: hypothetical protein LBQ24_01155 [Candidatus Peribacteria bacterium]|nr:hypothetical protein [Candidatus Peribacteria bacterium]
MCGFLSCKSTSHLHLKSSTTSKSSNHLFKIPYFSKILIIAQTLISFFTPDSFVIVRYVFAILACFQSQILKSLYK